MKPSFIIPKEMKAQLSGKTLLFDSCVVINIIKTGAESLLDELAGFGCEFAYIHMVRLELLRIDNPKERTQRLGILDQYSFFPIPINRVGLFEKAEEIQNNLHAYSCHPEPEDIYLGATIATIGLSDTYLLTTNHSDFPLPIYDRKGYIIIQNEKIVNLISVLKYNNHVL